VRDFIGTLLLVYLVVLAVRVVFSWFPPARSGIVAFLNSLAFDLTEPVLRPLRRIIPPVGMFDLSILVLFILLSLLRSAVLTG